MSTVEAAIGSRTKIVAITDVFGGVQNARGLDLRKLDEHVAATGLAAEADVGEFDNSPVEDNARRRALLGREGSG